jgi:thioesterase domain-containing protein
VQDFVARLAALGEIVPGTHQTMVFPPHVREIARVLERVLMPRHKRENLLE